MPPPPPPPPLPAHPSESRRIASEQDRATRTRRLRRQRLLAIGLIVLVAAAVAVVLVAATGGPAAQHHGGSTVAHAQGGSSRPAPAAKPAPSSFAVGLRVLHLVDRSRTIQLPNGTSRPRPLLTYVRYPALGSARATDLPNAPAARGNGPFPLVIFGHGYAVTPALYARMLQSWAHAGFVVAAPVFPLENANAPGGPNESDLTNQPADMSFLITEMLAAAKVAGGPFAGLIDTSRVAVSGQSDGGETALAVAYDPAYRDARVHAAVILSGAEIPGAEGFTFPASSPPLLATQGTADTVNLPSATRAFFDIAPRPKYLLRLLGAGHLPPYSYQQPQLGIVERVSIAFLRGYLDHRSSALTELATLGSVRGTASLLADR